MKISVITSAYNAQSTLARTIDSVLCQTFSDFEYLVIDHGSTDGTAGIIDKYAKKDSRIKKITIEQNLGHIGRALNLGMEVAKGEYVCFLDADDIYSESFMQSMYSAVTRENADIAVCGFIIVDSKQEHISKMVKKNYVLDSIEGYRQYAAAELHNELDSAYLDYWWNKLYRKNFILEHGFRFEAQRHVADAKFNLSIFSALPKAVFVQEYGVYYTFAVSSTSQKYYHSQYKEYIEYAEYWLEFIKKCNCTPEVYKRMGRRYWVFMQYLKAIKHQGEAEPILDDLCRWVSDDVIKNWVTICDVYLKQQCEVELALKLFYQKHGPMHLTLEDGFAKYYNTQGGKLDDEQFDFCLEYIFEEGNWFSLSAQSIAEAIAS